MDMRDNWNGKPTQSSVNSSHVTEQPIGGAIKTPEFNFNYHNKYTTHLNENINDVATGGGRRRRKSRKNRRKSRKSRRKKRKSRKSRQKKRRR